MKRISLNIISGEAVAGLGFFLVGLLLFSCQYDHLYKTPAGNRHGCDSVNVTYTKSVKPIFINNCYSCHSTAVTSATNGFDMENFASLKDYLTISYAGDGIYGSKFSHAIHQQGYLLYMPPTYKLNNCELGTIDKWIKAGAPNN
ncbi:MAG: hypothetical protein JSS79_15395 [Bacteroidetes bacterium]|nr:hypothetical protein [Bacteroidota bacterium]